MNYEDRMKDVRKRYRKVYKTIEQYAIYISIFLIVVCFVSGLIFKTRSPGIKFKIENPKPFDKNCVFDEYGDWNEEDLVCSALKLYENTGIQSYYVNLRFDRKEVDSSDLKIKAKKRVHNFMNDKTGILFVCSYIGTNFDHRTSDESFAVVSDSLITNSKILEIINYTGKTYRFNEVANQLSKKLNNKASSISLPFQLQLVYLHIALCSLVILIWLVTLVIKIALTVHETKVLDTIELMWITSDYAPKQTSK